MKSAPPALRFPQRIGRSKKGKKIKSGEVPLINDGTYGNYQQFLKILEMYLVSLGIDRGKQILLIADGAEWIWQHIPTLLNRLCYRPKIYYLLDFYHKKRTSKKFCALQALRMRKKV